VTRTRDVWAACLCGGMGLFIVGGLALQQKAEARRLRADVDTLTEAVLAMPHGDSRVGPEEAAALRDWSRRDGDDDPWPGVVRHSSMDRRPSEGGVR
jgi:hypothetical protein